MAEQQRRVRCMVCIAVTARSPSSSLSAAEALKYLARLLSEGGIEEALSKLRVEVRCVEVVGRPQPPRLSEG